MEHYTEWLGQPASNYAPENSTYAVLYGWKDVLTGELWEGVDKMTNFYKILYNLHYTMTTQETMMRTLYNEFGDKYIAQAKVTSIWTNIKEFNRDGPLYRKHMDNKLTALAARFFLTMAQKYSNQMYTEIFRHLEVRNEQPIQ